MRYRIIQVITKHGTYYLLQIRRWFIWRTVQRTEYHPVDGSTWKEDMKFGSKMSAYEYYFEYYMKPTKTIVEEG
jgi:hypothetical protein